MKRSSKPGIHRHSFSGCREHSGVVLYFVRNRAITEGLSICRIGVGSDTVTPTAAKPGSVTVSITSLVSNNYSKFPPKCVYRFAEKTGYFRPSLPISANDPEGPGHA